MGDEVSDSLEEAWLLDERQKKKIIKRLLLKWHPDKNLGQEAFATVITQHIYAEMERLDLGLPRPSQRTQHDFDPRNPFSGSTNFQKNFEDAYKFFFEQMNQRAKDHKDKGSSFKFDVPPTFASTNPQPAQAKRFFRQAQE